MAAEEENIIFLVESGCRKSCLSSMDGHILIHIRPVLIEVRVLLMITTRKMEDTKLRDR